MLRIYFREFGKLKKCEEKHHSFIIHLQLLLYCIYSGFFHCVCVCVCVYGVYVLISKLYLLNNCSSIHINTQVIFGLLYMTNKHFGLSTQYIASKIHNDVSAPLFKYCITYFKSRSAKQMEVVNASDEDALVYITKL